MADIACQLLTAGSINKQPTKRAERRAVCHFTTRRRFYSYYLRIATIKISASVGQTRVMSSMQPSGCFCLHWNQSLFIPSIAPTDMKQCINTSSHILVFPVSSIYSNNPVYEISLTTFSLHNHARFRTFP